MDKSNNRSSKLKQDTASGNGRSLLQPSTRLPLWKMDSFFRCPVVGMCLSMTEQRQVLKKAGFDRKNRDAFEVHELLVASFESDNRLSRCIDNLMQHRHGKQAVQLLNQDNNAFVNCFREEFEKGNVAVAVWAAAVHPGLSTDQKREIFGQIHMRMHTRAERHAALAKKLTCLEGKSAHLRRQAREIANSRRMEKKKRHQLETDLTQIRAKLAIREKENKGKETVPAVDTGRRQKKACDHDSGAPDRKLAAMHEQLELARKQIDALKKRNLRLSGKIEQQQALNLHLKEELRDILGGSLAALNRCDASCPAFDLCKKRVLIVGGITRMQSLYRALIERNGGIFEYHDGYMKKGQRDLEARMKRADVVLCPVGCNSHAACSKVKNLARKHNKTVHMLANTSLSAVSRVFQDGVKRGRIN